MSPETLMRPETYEADTQRLFAIGHRRYLPRENARESERERERERASEREREAGYRALSVCGSRRRLERLTTAVSTPCDAIPLLSRRRSSLGEEGP